MPITPEEREQVLSELSRFAEDLTGGLYGQPTL